MSIGVDPYYACQVTTPEKQLHHYRFESCPDYLNTGEYINWLDYVLWEHEVVGSSPASPTQLFHRLKNIRAVYV
jgi:hypothetical protein